MITLMIVMMSSWLERVWTWGTHEYSKKQLPGLIGPASPHHHHHHHNHRHCHHHQHHHCRHHHTHKPCPWHYHHSHDHCCHKTMPKAIIVWKFLQPNTSLIFQIKSHFQPILQIKCTVHLWYYAFSQNKSQCKSEKVEVIHGNSLHLLWHLTWATAQWASNLSKHFSFAFLRAVNRGAWVLPSCTNKQFLASEGGD